MRESKSMIGRYCIVRSVDAGVFAGVLEERVHDEVLLTNARRIWSWQGAASLSQLAMEGVKRPEDCRFAMPVHEIGILGVVEVIPCTVAAIDNIAGVPVWRCENG